MSDSSFLEASKEFERLFVEFHGDNIDRNDMVIKRFYEKLAAAFGSQWPRDVLMLYTRVRMFIRITALNKCIEVDAASAKFRRLKQLAQYTT